MRTGGPWRAGHGPPVRHTGADDDRGDVDEVTIAVLDMAAVEALERREPAGRQYVRPAFAAQTRGEQTVLVAWIDGVPVGSGEVTADVRPEFRNLRVDADRRGQGVGTRLIAAAEALATDRGVLRIGVALDNPDARRLYQRRGYAPTGEIEEYEYTYVDDDGRRMTVRESSEYLEKDLPARA